MVGEWLWGRYWGRIWAWAIGAGLLVGGLGLADTGNVIAAAVFAGVVIALIVLGSAALPRKWPSGRDLTVADRRAVSHAVHRGKDIGERRLAEPTIDLARIVMDEAERSRRTDLLMLLTGCFYVAIAVLVVQDEIGIPVFSAVVFVYIATFGRRTRERRAAAASRASSFAVTRLRSEETV